MESKHFSFTLKNVNISIINAIRRTLISGVPTFAFNPEDIVIDTNNSIFNNDFIKHRISMIPLTEQTKETIFEFSETNNTNFDVNFYTDYPGVLKDIFLFTLRPGQSLVFSAVSSLGGGADAMHSMVTNFNFVQKRNILFDDHPLVVKDLEQFEDIVERLPRVLESKDLYLDLNIIQNLNEIIGTDRIKIIDLPEYDLSFDMINENNAESFFKKAIEKLIDGLGEEEITDYSYSGMITYMYYREYTLKNHKKVLSIQKNHPTDKIFVLTHPTNKDISSEIRYCKCKLIEELRTTASRTNTV